MIHFDSRSDEVIYQFGVISSLTDARVSLLQIWEYLSRMPGILCLTEKALAWKFTLVRRCLYRPSSRWNRLSLLSFPFVPGTRFPFKAEGSKVESRALRFVSELSRQRCPLWAIFSWFSCLRSCSTDNGCVLETLLLSWWTVRASKSEIGQRTWRLQWSLRVEIWRSRKVQRLLFWQMMQVCRCDVNFGIVVECRSVLGSKRSAGFHGYGDETPCD